MARKFTCIDCGKGGFASYAEVDEHKKEECPTLNFVEVKPSPPRVPTAQEVALQARVSELELTIEALRKDLAAHEKPLVPVAKCPPELRYLSKGQFVALKVLGTLRAEGVEIESAALMR